MQVTVVITISIIVSPLQAFYMISITLSGYIELPSVLVGLSGKTDRDNVFRKKAKLIKLAWK